MKAQKTKDGKLLIKVKKSEPIISHWSNPNSEAKANAQFGRSLRNSKQVPMIKVSDHKYIRSGIADWE